MMEEMEHSSYDTAEQFAQDLSFQNYVRMNNTHDVEKWRAWVRRNPDKSPLMRKAIEMIISRPPKTTSIL
jgi:hypothetical protein